MGDKPGKYWDYRECAWVRCPTAPDGAVGVPAQERPAEAADAEDATVVGTAH